MDVPPPSLLRLPLPIGISLVPCLLHRLGLCNQAIDLLTAEDIPQEAEVFDFCPGAISFSSVRRSLKAVRCSFSRYSRPLVVFSR